MRFLPSTRSQLRSPKGFTLVEVVVIVLILGIVTAVAMSKAPAISNQAKINATMTQVRHFHTAAETFYVKNERWANDAGPGVFPVDFVGFLSQKDFARPPGIGGKWDWNGPGTTSPNYYGIAVIYETAADVPTSLVTELDAEFDDGDLNTGKIQLETFGTKRGLQFPLAPIP